MLRIEVGSANGRKLMRRMSGSQREREARPSSETVHHIVKSEVNASINALEARVNERINALEAGVTAKLDKCISAIHMLSRERQATGRLEA